MGSGASKNIDEILEQVERLGKEDSRGGFEKEYNNVLKQKVAVMDALSSAAAVLEAKGDKEKALELYQKALQVYVECLGPSSEKAIQVSCSIASIYRSLGKFDDAIMALEEMLDRLETGCEGRMVHGKANTEHHIVARCEERSNNTDVNNDRVVFIADTLSSIGVIMQKQKRLKEALQMQEKSLRNFQRAKPTQTLKMGKTLNLMGSLCQQMRDWEKAYTYFEQALALLRQEGSPVVNTLNNMGLICTVRKDFDRAVEHYQESLAILQQNTPDMEKGENYLLKRSQIHKMIALAYLQVGKHSLALQAYEEHLKLEETLHGTQNVRVADTLIAVARVCSSLEEFPRSLEFFQRALDILRANSSESNTSKICHVMNAMALVHHQQGQVNRALELYDKTLELKQINPRVSKASLAEAFVFVATLHQQHGHLERAASLIEDAIAMQEGSLHAEHPAIGKTVAFLAAVQHKMGNLEYAEKLYHRAVRIKKHAKETGDNEGSRGSAESLANTINNLGLLCVEKQDFQSAQIHFEESLMLKRSSLGSHASTAETIHCLAAVHEELGEKQTALELYAEAFEIKMEQLGPCQSVGETLLNMSQIHPNKTAALTLARDALTIFVQALGEAHPYTERAKERVATMQALI